MTSWRSWISSVRSAGELADASVNVVGVDSVRLDLECFAPNEHPQEQRRTVILSIEQAMKMVVMMTRAIEQAEVNQSKRKKK